MLAYLTAFPKKSRDVTVDLDAGPSSSKRPHLGNNLPLNPVRCHNCGKVGHLRRQYRFPDRRNKQSERSKTPERINKGNNAGDGKIVCSFCAKGGHTVEKCFTKTAIEQRRKVNFCKTGISAVPTTASVDGIKFRALIDTGSDVSLISERFRSLFVNKIESHPLVLKGISPGNLNVHE